MSKGGALGDVEVGLRVLLLFSELLPDFFQLFFVSSLVDIKGGRFLFGSIVDLFLLVQKVLADDDFQLLHGPGLKLLLQVTRKILTILQEIFILVLWDVLSEVNLFGLHFLLARHL